LPRQLDADLMALLGELGSPVRSAEPVGRLASPASTRATFKVCLRDGRLLKARRVESARRCEILAVIWPLVRDMPISRGLAYRGAALLEQWIQGRAFGPEDETPERLRDAGDLLGRLHQIRQPAGTPRRREPDPGHLLGAVEKRLDALSAMSMLSDNECRSLLDRARRHVPERLDSGLIHHDFCAENLLITTEDRLYAIDNEDMRFGILDADLARTFLRWPMTAQERDAFLTGYSQHRVTETYEAHECFWTIWAVAGAIEFRARRGLPCQALLSRLLGQA